MTLATRTDRRLVTIALMAGIAMAALEATVVGTAMPTIVGNLGGIALLSWVFSVYLLTSTVTVPIYGKLADLHGRKPVFVAGALVFVLGSALCGTSTSMEQLVVFRAIQGIGAGAVLPIALTIIGDIYPLEQRARFQGVFSSVWAVSSVLGPALGGFLTDHVHWRWVFLINVPVGAAACGLLWLTLHEEIRPRPRRLDVAGALCLTGSVTTLLIALNEGGKSFGWTAPQTLGLLALSALGLLSFVQVERRVAEPLMPPQLFRHRIQVAANVGNFLSGVMLFGSTSFVPIFVQGVLGGSAVSAGSVLTPMSLCWTMGSVIGGRVLLRLGYRASAVIGMALVLLAALLLVQLTEGSSLAIAVGSMAPLGMGLGFATLAYLLSVQNAVPWEQRGIATSAAQFFRTIGGSVGVAFMGAAFNARAVAQLSSRGSGDLAVLNQLLEPETRPLLGPALVEDLRDVLASSLSATFLLLVFVAAAGLIASWWLPGGRAEEHTWQASQERRQSGSPR